MKKLLIFDVDGVLEKEELIENVRKKRLIKAIAERKKVSLNYAKELFEKAKQNLPENKKNTTMYQMNYLGFSRKETFKLLDEIDPTGIISPHENCLKMLNELKKKKIVMVTYSNSPKKAVTKTLRELEIKKYFKKYFSSEEFNESKPSERNLKRILKTMNFEADNTIMVGNSYEKDILPASKMGIKTILYDPKRKYKKNPGADFIIIDLIEIVENV